MRARSLAAFVSALAGCFPGGNDPVIYVGDDPPACDDDLDDDGDGTADAADLGCQGLDDDDESLRTDTWLLGGDIPCLQAPPCDGITPDDVLVELEDAPLPPAQYALVPESLCPTGLRLSIASALFRPGRRASITYTVAPTACP